MKAQDSRSTRMMILSEQYPSPISEGRENNDEEMGATGDKK
jgi:hypothetical protein